MTALSIAHLSQSISQFFQPMAAAQPPATQPKLNKLPTPKRSQLTAEQAYFLRHLHRRQSQPAPAVPPLVSHFWHTIMAALADGTFTFELLTDRPSDYYAHGVIWLTQERVTALLQESQLDCQHLSPLDFHLILPQTDALYPSAYVGYQPIISEVATQTLPDGTVTGERRWGFCIRVQVLRQRLSQASAQR